MPETALRIAGLVAITIGSALSGWCAADDGDNDHGCRGP